ncbi:MAG: hypothetical protein WDO71_19450 [Bacteroidota bacterium]
MPDLCEPVLDCKGFETVISDFYQEHGAAIAVSGDCHALFVDFFNDHFGTSYTWDDLVALYKSLCNAKLDVCSRYTCKWLQQVLDSWHSCHNSVWTDDNCLEQWVVYFNGATGSSLLSSQIDSLYSLCNIILDPCFPPVDCNLLQSLVSGYNNGGINMCRDWYHLL